MEVWFWCFLFNSCLFAFYRDLFSGPTARRLSKRSLIQFIYNAEVGIDFKFNFYEMLELELISNSIYIQWWSWNWFQIQFIYNAEVGVDSILRLFSHSWRKKEKIIFALLSLYLLFSKIMEKHKPKPRILTELLQSAKPRQSQR